MPVVATSRAAFKHASPSQIKTYRACQVKWLYQSILKYPTPVKPHLLTGKKCHEEIEEYLAQGTPPGRIMTAGIHRLPKPPIPRDHIEHSAALLDESLPVPVVLMVDLLEPSTTQVTDHKTTSNFKYALTPEELRHDVQAIVYGVHAAALYAGIATPTGDTYTARGTQYPIYRPRFDASAGVTFRHVYYRTSGAPKSKETAVKLTPEDLRKGWDGIKKDVRQMAIDATKQPAELPDSRSHCGAYGGCPFVGPCNAAFNRSPFHALRKKEPVSMSAFLKNMSEKKKNNGVQETATSATKRPKVNPPDGVQESADYIEPAPLLMEVKSPRIPAQLKDVVSPLEAPDSPLVGKTFAGLSKQLLQHLCVKLLEELERREEITAQTVEWGAICTDNMKKQEVKHVAISLAALLLGQIDKVVIDSVEIPTCDAPTVTYKPAPTAAPAPASSTVVYVGCIPRGSQVAYLADIIKPLQQRTADALQVPHYRVADYSKGLNLLVGFFAEQLESGDLALPERVVVDPHSHFASACVDVLANVEGVQLVDRFGV